jgi:hypothetical protein
MSAGKLNLSIEQGVTWDLHLIVFEPDGVTLCDLTIYTARMQIRKKKNSPICQLELTTENGGIKLGGALGTIDIHISAAQAASLTSSTAYWDLELVSEGSGDLEGEVIVDRLVEGSVTLSKEVTREIV